ncbi:hypothetical protein BKA81DRAFT_348890 [Phyllosticta paracitricarpa]
MYMPLTQTTNRQPANNKPTNQSAPAACACVQPSKAASGTFTTQALKFKAPHGQPNAAPWVARTRNRGHVAVVWTWPSCALAD